MNNEYIDLFVYTANIIVCYSSRLSLVGSKTQFNTSCTENVPGSLHERKDGGETLIPAPTTTKRASFIEVLTNYYKNKNYQWYKVYIAYSV